MIYGVDVHPQYQAGINIERIRAEGFDFMAVKLSESTATFNGLDWIRRGQACGLLSLGYHYLRPGNEVGQASVFCQQLAATGGVPGMLDAEALAEDGKTPTLNVAGIHRFLDACASNGARVPLLYLPRWYWQRMGSPDLTGLPMLWASSYVFGSDYASVLYEKVSPSYWSSYGNLPIAVLQFTDKALVAGQRIDANAYLGTRDDFAKLIGSAAPITPLTSGGHEVQNFRVQGIGTLPVICPVGKPSAIVDTAWISACSDGPAGGKVRFWFQNDTAGISDESREVTFSDGRSSRPWVQVPDGTTMIRVEYAFTSQATICLETRAKK